MKTLLVATFGTFLFAGAALADPKCFWSEDRGVTIHAPYQLDLADPGRRAADPIGLSRNYGLESWRRARLGRTGPNPFAWFLGAREPLSDGPRRACGERNGNR